MPDSKATLDKMAGEIFDLYRLIAKARSQAPSGPEVLSESEFLTLDALTKEQPLTIGEVQKRIGVVPAQMSRIVRALEEQGGRGFVECHINPKDRRRIDISLTKAGQQAYNQFRTNRLASMYKVLTVLAPKDRLDFMRMMRELVTAFEDKLD